MQYLLIAIIAFSVLLRLFAPQIKGYLGERVIRRVLARLPEAEYSVLHDVLISSENGTAQVDHIVVSKYGIFVIETKNYQGWIFGDEYAKQWTQTIYRRKSRFMNPIHQNYGHIQALKKLLVMGDDDFISVVAFSRRCKLKFKHDIENVVYYNQLKDTIARYHNERLSPEQITEIVQKIAENNIVDKSLRRKHIQDIRQRIS